MVRMSIEKDTESGGMAQIEVVEGLTEVLPHPSI